MATGMPELGSKISLISKADIRYEGRLFTVDPSECTIALANVCSFGTEDRESQFPIAPQDLVYDYILFRGSDIKDIRVVNNVAIPQDSAIIQMQMHPVQQMMGPGPVGGVGVGGVGGGYAGQHQQFQPQMMGGVVGGHMPLMGGGGAVGGYNAMGGLGGPLGPGGMGGMAPGANMSGLHKTKQTTSVLDLIGGGSRSTTPISMHSRKSPEMGMQQQQQQQHQLQQQQMRNQQFHGNNQQNRGWNNNNNSRGGLQQQQQQQQLQGANMLLNGSQMRGQRGRGGRGPMNQGGYRQTVHQQQNPNKAGGQGRPPKTTIKFESDYDFEQANTKFEELRMELAKLKVGDDAKPEQVNGETDKKDDSGNETGAGEHEQEDDDVVAGAPSSVVGYDKAKSFFDNISCEAATDRTKGKNRTDWRHERKINSETFGVSARRGGFFNFRGRGGYYNRNNNQNQMNPSQQGGGGLGGSGGYRPNNNNNQSNGSGGYRQNNGGYRGRNYNNRSYQHQNQSTGIPVQPTINKQLQPQPQQDASGSNAAPISSSSNNTNAASSASTSDTVPMPAPVAAN